MTSTTTATPLNHAESRPGVVVRPAPSVAYCKYRGASVVPEGHLRRLRQHRILDITDLAAQPRTATHGDLFPHQAWAVDWLVHEWRRRRASAPGRPAPASPVLAFPPGTGKTVVVARFLASVLAERVGPVLLITKGHLVRQTAAQLAAWLTTDGQEVRAKGRSQYLLAAGDNQVGMCVTGKKTKHRPLPGDLAWLLQQEGARVHVISADILVGQTGRDFDYGHYAATVVDEAHAATRLVKHLARDLAEGQPPVYVSASAIEVCQLTELQYMAPFLDNCKVSVATFRLTEEVQQHLGMPPIRPVVSRVAYGGASLPEYWHRLACIMLEAGGDVDRARAMKPVLPYLCCLVRAACWDAAREAPSSGTRRSLPAAHYRSLKVDLLDSAISWGAPACRALIEDDSSCLEFCKSRRRHGEFWSALQDVAADSFHRELDATPEGPPGGGDAWEPPPLEALLLKARRKDFFRRRLWGRAHEATQELLGDASTACQLARASGHLSLLLITPLDAVGVAERLKGSMLMQGEVIETRAVHSGQGHQRCKALEQARRACWPDRSATLATLRRLHRQTGHVRGIAAVLRRGHLLRAIFSYLKTTVVVVADETSLTLGYNLQGTFDALLCLDMPQSAEELQQRVGRVRRMTALGRPNWPTQPFVLLRAGTLDALAAGKIGLRAD